ncbi:HD domain-containing protein [Geobacter hydrogenophilus]|nr:HD domain-containing protein [Geobacter hydrogenophilus]MBT0895669.1 HD domain-containing protein [Geobacter hydrogenophilus]
MTQLTWQDLYIKAYRFAALAHSGQTVPDTDIPYLMHLSLVSMEVIASFSAEPDVDTALAVQCALLHDVIEDTAITYEQVLADFGPMVAAGVLALTKDERFPSKQEQLADSLRRIREQSREVWMVKLADRITNLQPPPSYWTTEKRQSYRAEAVSILDSLGEASPCLAGRLREKIDAYAVHLYPKSETL